MSRGARWRVISAVAFLCILVTASIAIRSVWERLCGNSPIRVYGRIVDEVGRPIAGVTVKYRITYSSSIALPVMFGRGELFKDVSAQADANGDYEISGIHGYFVNLVGVFSGPVPLESAMGIPAPKEMGWSLDDASQRASMPDMPGKRVTYEFRRSPP
jgi:hypothetical protein